MESQVNEEPFYPIRDSLTGETYGDNEATGETVHQNLDYDVFQAPGYTSPARI